MSHSKNIVKAVIMVLGLSLSTASIISGLSVAQLFADPSNVDVRTEDLMLEQSGGGYRLTIPFSVNNQGFYDITNFRLRYNVTLFNETVDPVEVLVVDSVQDFGTFPARTNTSATIQILFNESTQFTQAQWLAYDFKLRVHLEFSGRYTMDLVSFRIGYQMEHDPF